MIRTRKDRNQLFLKAFNEMPDIFTSNDYVAKVKEIGLTSEEIARGNCSSFLHKVCDKDQKSRIWIKKHLYRLTNRRVVNNIQMDESEMIEILKLKGFTITKTIQY